MLMTQNRDNGKTLAEWLNGHKDLKRVIIIFKHGMGDCVMFMPLYERVKQTWPDRNFSLICNKGQKYFEDGKNDSFDLRFEVIFPEFDMIMPWGGPFYGMSKPEICCVHELGIHFDASLDFTWKPKYVNALKEPLRKNTIGMAFQVTSNPNKGLDEETAQKVWEEVCNAGFNPVEVHFEHNLQNRRNERFSFVGENTFRDVPATIENVVSAINECKGFVGVNTGTFCMATAMKDKKTLHLFKRWHFCPNYLKNWQIPEVDCTKSEIDFGPLREYLDSLGADSTPPKKIENFELFC